MWNSDEDLTRDAFLGGRLRVWQPKRGYRAGIDPVLLAAATDASPGQAVLDIGCGVGVASLSLMARIPDLRTTGLELLPVYAALARRNAVENHLKINVIEGDLRSIPPELREEGFDHVIANPPYFDRDRGTRSTDSNRETALGEMVPLARWIDCGIRRLAPKGTLYVIQRAERLPELLSACDDRLGDMRVLPLLPRRGRPARLVILRAVKGPRGGFGLLAPILLHSGNRHGSEGDGFSEEIESVLRHGDRLAVDWAGSRFRPHLPAS